MKNLYKYAFMGILALGLGSCDDDEENITVVVQDTVETGAVLRTIQITSNEFPIGQTDALFSAELEEQDEFEGDLLESVDVFITYTDGSPDDGDSTGGITDEVAFRTITADEFAPGPFALPRFTLTISFAEMLAAVNLTDDQTFGGDSFNTRLSLNLTDGRIFSVNNAGGIITAGFFNSPFQYVTPVVCPVGETEFIGDYTLENITAVDFGNLYAEGSTVTISQPGDVSVERQFTAEALADLDIGQGATDFIFQMVCDLVIPNTGLGTNLGCGGSLTLGPPIGDTFGTYTTGDDSEFTIVIGYNESGDATCAVGSDGEIRLTKQ